jgi:hypothetical protein
VVYARNCFISGGVSITPSLIQEDPWEKCESNREETIMAHHGHLETGLFSQRNFPKLDTTIVLVIGTGGG